jgi:dipeptidyl aminopeptidase/acylaminoacyl peptidase
VAVRPYGTWPSDLDADIVAGGSGRSFGLTDLSSGPLRWTEIRTYESGRTAVVEARPDGELVDVTPPGANARTRVHEYGGGAVWFHGDATFFSDFDDSRLYRVDGAGAEARPITPEPAEPHALRYADGCVTPDGATIFCVRERHEAGEVHNELVVLPADGSAEPRIVAGRHDFFMAPRLDPAGRRLVWLAWDHPRMPWDGTELMVADVEAGGTLGVPRLVAGGPDESVIDPRFAPGGALHYCSDRTGWWNLYREDGTAVTSLEDAEIGFPAWVFGMSRYVFLGDGRIACVVTRAAIDSLELLEPGSSELRPAGLGWSSFGPASLSAGGGRVVFSAASPTAPTALVSYEPDSGGETIIRRSIDVDLDPASISVPRAIEFPTGDGATAHAFYYPPANGEYEGPADDLPPLRVICHGGPTANTTPALGIEVQFFTQRGIGVLDVNYRGSTGYGRAYRQLLNGRWGEIDWQDCIAAARHLAEQGEVDRDRTWVEGGSAGGYVVLCALVFDPTAFAAGVSSLRRRRRRGARDRHAQVRVALPRLDDRPVSRARRSLPRPFARSLRRAARAAAASAARARRQGRPAEPGRSDGRGARAEGHPVRVPRVRGRGPRLPPEGEHQALARGDALVRRAGVRVRRCGRARIARNRPSIGGSGGTVAEPQGRAGRRAAASSL